MNTIPKVILLLETSRAYGRGLLNGIARYSKLNGPWSFYREPRSLESAIPHLEEWNANGIIMRNSIDNRQLMDLRLPTIMVPHETLKKTGHVPVVIPDCRSIAQMAADHLLSKGLRHFAYCGIDEIFWSENRKQVFCRIMDAAGFLVDVYERPRSKKIRSWENEQSLIEAWIRTLPKPVGIMACNDDRGGHVLEACKAGGFRVPEDVAVIGVDNDVLSCDLSDPPLTSVAQDTESAGYDTAELLDRLMKGEPMRGQEILVKATHVVERQSTDVLAIDDANVAAAIRFIRQNAKEKIFVDDVVFQTSLSRRSLEGHFRKSIHRSIQEEIQRVRTEQIANMLIETSMSISEITTVFNFTDVEHISRYFRKEKGVGPREFRKINRR
jgi:LacI family transcriptional regulator